MIDSQTTFGPGIHRIDADLYHTDPVDGLSLTSSIARLLIFNSPLHAWTAHPRLNPDHEPTESRTFDIGRAAHRAVLGAGGGYVAYPEDILASNGAASTKAAKEWANDQRAAGLTPLKSADVDAIARMADKVHDRLAQLKIRLDSGRSEISAIGQVEDAMCRAMVDNAPTDANDPLWDFKTTTDASPDHCTRAVMNYGYDVQAAFYIDTWKAATGEDRQFRFIFQEKTAPFEVCVVSLGDESLGMGRKKARRARDIWRQCLASNHWPGYPAGIHRAELPAWFHERWLERESSEADFRQRHGTDILDQARRWQSPADFAAE